MRDGSAPRCEEGEARIDCILIRRNAGSGYGKSNPCGKRLCISAETPTNDLLVDNKVRWWGAHKWDAQCMLQLCVKAKQGKLATLQSVHPNL